MIEVDKELNNLNKYLNEILKPNIYANRKSEIKSCPSCGCSRYIKYGFFKGIQRYRCKECGNLFIQGALNALESISPIFFRHILV